jgi:hypothetical protein
MALLWQMSTSPSTSLHQSNTSNFLRKGPLHHTIIDSRRRHDWQLQETPLTAVALVQTELFAPQAHCVAEWAVSPWALAKGVLDEVSLHFPVVHILDVILNVLWSTAVDSKHQAALPFCQVLP